MRMLHAVVIAAIGLGAMSAFGDEAQFEKEEAKLQALVDKTREKIADTRPRMRTTEVITKHVARIPANPSPEFHMVASPDFKRLAMTEPYDKDRWYIAVDDRVWEFYELVDTASLQFSADSKHLLCAAKWENYWFLVMDNHGKAAELPGKPTEVRFMPDGKSVAYIAHDEKQACAVIAGVAGPMYDDVRELTISADGKQSAYVATKGVKQFVVLNGKETPATQIVSTLVFAKDGLRWLEFEKKENGGSVILESVDHEVKRWDMKTEFRSASLSPDANAVAIVDAPEKNGKFERLTTNGVTLDKQYAKIERITWGPGNVQAFVGTVETRSVIFPKDIVDTWQVLVVGGKEDSHNYAQIAGEPIFTDGSEELTFYVHFRKGDSAFNCRVWRPRERESRAATMWSDVDVSVRLKAGSVYTKGDVSSFAEQNLLGKVLSVRPDGTHKRNVLRSSPAGISVSEKQMMDVTLYGIQESEK